MMSEWRVTSNLIGDQMKYGVYRLIDTGETDHSGNREFASDYMSSKERALKIAHELNEIEQNK
jgi:hypothetical protein